MRCLFNFFAYFLGFYLGSVRIEGSSEEQQSSIKLPFTPSKVYVSVDVEGTSCVDNDFSLSYSISYKRVTLTTKSLLPIKVSFITSRW